MKYSIRDIPRRAWPAIIAVALFLALLRELFLPAFFLIFNTLIIVYAGLIAIRALVSPYAPLYGIACLSGGVLLHAWEIKKMERAGECPMNYGEGMLSYIRAIDQCMDYSESWVFYGQTLLLGGALIIIFYLFGEIAETYRFIRRERALGASRSKR